MKLQVTYAIRAIFSLTVAYCTPAMRPIRICHRKRADYFVLIARFERFLLECNILVMEQFIFVFITRPERGKENRLHEEIV